MLEKLKSWIRRYFGFSGTESNGFMVLVILFPVVLVLPVFLKVVINQNTSDTTVNTQQLDSLVTLMEQKIASREQPGNRTKGMPRENLAKFNPNTADMEELLDLGLRKQIALRIINYRQKGGHFYIKGDFKKIYGLTEDEFNRLLPYLDLPDNIQPEQKKPVNQGKYAGYTDKIPAAKFDINQADTARLRSIRGIGHKLSTRIIKFRNRLGGFITIDQLDQVYGLSGEALKSIRERGFVNDQFQPELININEADVNTISKHPYASVKLANQIVKYREQHGKYEYLEQLMNIHLMDKHSYDKLKPYLTL